MKTKIIIIVIVIKIKIKSFSDYISYIFGFI